MRRRNPSAGLVVFRVKLRQREYTRTVTGLYRVLRRNGEMAVKPKNPKYIPIPYEQMNYPGDEITPSAIEFSYPIIFGDEQLYIWSYNL